MKLQKQVSRKVGSTEYAKYVLVIPKKIITALGWQTGQELTFEMKKNKLLLAQKGKK